jgi:hypothetical protein
MRCETIDLNTIRISIFEEKQRTWASGTPVSIDKRDIEYDERRCRTSVFNVDELSVGKEASNVDGSITSNKP